MIWFKLGLCLYGAAVILLTWRYSVICNRLRKQLLISKGVKTDFASFLPQILWDAFRFPFAILWNGLHLWLKELE